MTLPKVKSRGRKRKATGTYKRKPRLLKDGSVAERVIQYEVLRWLESTNLLHWRANSGHVFVHGRKISLGPDGISDVVIVIPPTGRFLGLEIKSAKGTIRAVQKAFRDRVLAVGGYYRVVRTLKEAQNCVAEIVGDQLWKQLQQSNSEPAQEYAHYNSGLTRSKRQSLLPPDTGFMTWT